MYKEIFNESINLLIQNEIHNFYNFDFDFETKQKKIKKKMADDDQELRDRLNKLVEQEK